MIFHEIAARVAAARRLRAVAVRAQPPRARIAAVWRRDAASGRLHIAWKKVAEPGGRLAR